MIALILLAFTIWAVLFAAGYLRARAHSPEAGRAFLRAFRYGLTRDPRYQPKDD